MDALNKLFSSVEMSRPPSRTTYKYSDNFEATAVRLSDLPFVELQDVVAKQTKLIADSGYNAQAGERSAENIPPRHFPSVMKRHPDRW